MCVLKCLWLLVAYYTCSWFRELKWSFRLLKLRSSLRLTMVLTLLQPSVLLVRTLKNGGRRTLVGNMTLP